jgi:hypothetical protein
MLSPLVARALNKGNERVIALSARRSADHLTHAQVPSPNSTSGLVMGRYPGNFTTLMSISTLKLANL